MIPGIGGAEGLGRISVWEFSALVAGWREYHKSSSEDDKPPAIDEDRADELLSEAILHGG